MRDSLAYTLARHLIHLRLVRLAATLRHPDGIPADAFDTLVRDMKRSRHAIDRIHSIWRTL